MKVIIAGSRNLEVNFENLLVLHDIIKTVRDIHGEVSLVVSGGARGADTLGEVYASLNKIEYVQYKPDWGLYGKAAGPLRNAQMAKFADILILLWDGKSKGSSSMKSLASRNNLFIYEKIVEISAS